MDSHISLFKLDPYFVQHKKIERSIFIYKHIVCCDLFLLSLRLTFTVAQ